MKTRAILVLFLIAAAGVASFAETPPPEQMTVLDCYLALPNNFLETPPAAWLRKCPVIDSKGGYMRCQGEGVQPPFEATLFHYTNGRPLFAICQGQLRGGVSRFLDFFEVTDEKRLRPVDRSIFPLEDGDYNKGNAYFFDLPRGGKTVLVRDQTSGKVLHKITWTGEKFVEEK